MWYHDTVLGRLLGRVLAARAPAEARRRRARHLVVGRRKGEENWVVAMAQRAWRVAMASVRRMRHSPFASRASRTPRDAEPMLAYIVRRLLLMIPTIFGIMLVSFAIVQFVPGGPVERAIAQLQGDDESSTRAASAAAAARSAPARRRTPAATFPRAIAARRGSIRNSSRSWRSNTASTSRRPSASGCWCATTRPSISARATIATRRSSS